MPIVAVSLLITIYWIIVRKSLSLLLGLEHIGKMTKHMLKKRTVQWYTSWWVMVVLKAEKFGKHWLSFIVCLESISIFSTFIETVKKEGLGAKISKKYDQAKTSYQRILLSEHISQAQKDALAKEYKSLDPVDLLAQLEAMQDYLWTFSWDKSGNTHTHLEVAAEKVVDKTDANVSQEMSSTL
ncbi:MAG: hypothetical protein K0U59_10285 [Gammaproteobacteria bacterium]|nr:hypothetical protein [Gammaproteobacteria bacterium]